MAGAGAALVLGTKPAVMTGAVPTALDGRGMQTGPAVHRSRFAGVAGSMVRTHAALEPGRIIADPGRRMLGINGAFGLVEQPGCSFRIGLDPLDMQRVCVLADRNVHGPGQPGQVHVDLHLGGVLRFRFHNALGD